MTKITQFPKPMIKDGRNMIKEQVDRLLRSKEIPESVYEQIMNEFEIYKFAYDPKFNVLNFDYGDKFIIDDIEVLNEEQIRAVRDAFKLKINFIVNQLKTDTVFTMIVKLIFDS